MALLRPSKENTPPRSDLVEQHPPMIESSLYSIVSDYEDRSLGFQGFCEAGPSHEDEAPTAFLLSFPIRACRGKKDG
ncbi:hypothetical protein L3X38_018382 [Prunus dulcis]|uniref:Uncharacterized protein n=1 Tax=Prunus dulcis TaxID=3755 RepID=A0AAD4W8Y5_PRUDU|nr:hypothetical protein L3X38_018382 [Prunus dulcis]